MTKDTATQLRVGIFMAIGLTAIALMVVYFGRFGDGIRKYYQIRVEYPNASGLLKGASVLLAGAKIGSVETSPTILPNMDGVYVMLKIYDEVKIPSASEFSVGSSGLLGDRFVVINLKKDAKDSPPIEPGTVIQGKGESGGLGDMAEKAGEVMSDVREAVQNINKIAEKLNTQVFQESSMKDLNETMANLKATSASFAESSKKIDSIMDEAKTAVATGQETLASAKSAADEFKKTMTDVRGLVGQVRAGRGPLGVLLTDREMAENLKSLVANLKRHGILWYKDAERGKPVPNR